jgi:F0F1-type ATP synthase membrane subunit b/b'
MAAMPTWLAIVLIVLVVLIVVFAIGGYVAAKRRAEARAARLLRELAEANEALARARALDRGWDRDHIDAAARAAHLADRPDARIDAVQLVQVADRPGVEDDEAVVRISDDAGQHEVRLGRRGGAWGRAAR